MSRLIDAERLKAHYCWWAGGGREMTIDEAKKTFDTIVDLQPTVDAEPVVRCKNCRWREETECTRFSDIRPNDDDFCSRGERKEDAETN